MKIILSNQMDDQLNILQKEIHEILSDRPQKEKLLEKLNHKKKEYSEKYPKSVGNLYYFGEKDDKGEMKGNGYFNQNDEIIFWGEFRDNFFYKGTLVKKTKDNSKIDVFKGEFQRNIVKIDNVQSNKETEIIKETSQSSVESDNKSMDDQSKDENKESIQKGDNSNNSSLNKEQNHNDFEKEAVPKEESKENNTDIVEDLSSSNHAKNEESESKSEIHTVFKGNFYPHIDENEQLEKYTAAIKGTIINNDKIDGLVIYLYDPKDVKRGEALYGKLNDFKKQGDILIYKFEEDNKNNIFFIGKFEKDQPIDQVCHSKKGNEYLLNITYKNGEVDNITTDYWIIKDDIFIGEVIHQSNSEDENAALYSFKVGRKGDVLYKNNHYYNGTFTDDGKKDGEGIYIARRTDEDNIEHIYTIKGNFKNDNIVDGKVYRGREEIPENLIFEGRFKDNQVSNGKYIYSENEYYEGDFINNMRENSGVYHYSDGSVYEGHWSKNLKHGQGAYTDKNQKKTECRFNEDKICY